MKADDHAIRSQSPRPRLGRPRGFSDTSKAVIVSKVHPPSESRGGFFVLCQFGRPSPEEMAMSFVDASSSIAAILLA